MSQHSCQHQNGVCGITEIHNNYLFLNTIFYSEHRVFERAQQRFLAEI